MKFLANGSDHFQILLEKQMRDYSVHGNVGRLLLKVKGDQIKDLVECRLNSTIAKEIYALKFHLKWLTSAPYWKTEDNAKICPLKRKDYQGDNLIEQLPLPDFNLKRAQLYKTFLINFKGEEYFLFIWHHVLFDARGGEVFARYLIGETTSLNREDVFPVLAPRPLVEILNESKAAKDYFMSELGLKIDSAANKNESKSAKVKYRFIEFSEDETLRIAKKSSTMVRLVKSPFYLACTAMSFKKLLEDRNVDWTSFWIPVPQDQRLRGSVKPIMGNHISYLFFRLHPEDCTDLKSVAQNFSKQMMQQIRDKIPVKYASMMRMFSRTPIWFYDMIVRGRSKRAFASFFFSDTGMSFNAPNDEGPVQIENAWHLPPANAFPGITVIYSMFRNKLQLSICHTTDSMTESEVVKFELNLKDQLLLNES